MRILPRAYAVIPFAYADTLKGRVLANLARHLDGALTRRRLRLAAMICYLAEWLGGPDRVWAAVRITVRTLRRTRRSA